MKVDGLVRGLASGSAMTLRPRRHDIELRAEGFEPKRMAVEARGTTGNPTEIVVELARR